MKVAFYRKLCVAGTTLLGAGAQGKTMSLRELVEATLHGRDERLVAKCNVPAILQVFERWDIYELDTLASTLTASFAELQADMEQVAARSFLGLLKVTLSKATSPQPPQTRRLPPHLRTRHSRKHHHSIRRHSIHRRQQWCLS